MISAQRAIKLAGSLLVVISLLFILQRLWDERRIVSSHDFSINTLILLTACSLIYALACLALSASWSSYVKHLAKPKVNERQLLCIFSKTQLAKYVPGNFMHLAGRHFMARQLGIANTALAIATVLEVGGLVSAASTLSSISYFVETQTLEHSAWSAIPVITLLSLFFYFFSPMIAAMVTNSHIDTHHSELIGTLIKCYLRYLLFFVISGLIVVFILKHLNSSLEFANLPPVLLVFSIAWVIGFLTPGAPSGIGIRESVMILSLENLIPGSSALIVALLVRLVTISGDVVFWLSTIPFCNRVSAHAHR